MHPNSGLALPLTPPRHIIVDLHPYLCLSTTALWRISSCLSMFYTRRLPLISVRLPYLVFRFCLLPCQQYISSAENHIVLPHRRASSAQPVFRRSSTILNNMLAVNDYANTDFSGFDWTGMNFNTQLVQDTCPLPHVELKFNGFSFDSASNCALDDSSLTSNPLSSSASSFSFQS